MANSNDAASVEDPWAAQRRCHTSLLDGCALPAHPLALTAELKLDERRQRALTRYYLAAGAGGLAVGVHTTQFGIHDPRCGLLKPVWQLAQEEMDRAEAGRRQSLVRVAGICGDRDQAVREAQMAADLGYQYGLVSLGAYLGRGLDEMLDHCRAVGEHLKLFGFYLQPAVGGVELPYGFWRSFCELESAAAIKVAAFNRYRTLDVLRAVADSGRRDIALYSGNDDNIVGDLTTEFAFHAGEGRSAVAFVGGLLGQWAVWTSEAVRLQRRCREERRAGRLSLELTTLGAQLTDANGAIFDASNGFRGCLPGIHEVLRRQGLLAGTWCLDEREQLSAGQAEEISRVIASYPSLTDDHFVAEHLDQWLSD